MEICSIPWNVLPEKASIVITFFAVVIFKLYGINKKGSGKRLKQVGMGSGTNKGNGFLIFVFDPN